MESEIKIKIKNCKECPFVVIMPHFTADSFENAYNWFCSKKNGKKIQGYVEFHEEKNIQIPNWCPIKVKQ